MVQSTLTDNCSLNLLNKTYQVLLVLFCLLICLPVSFYDDIIGVSIFTCLFVFFFFWQDGVMTLSGTQRYREKFVSTLLYKPINCK